MTETINIAKLVSTYEARTAQFERSLKRIEKKNGRTTKRMSGQFKTLNSSIARASSTLGKFGSAFGVGLGAGALAGIPTAINSAIDAGASLIDVSQKVGLTTDKLQELRFAGAQVGLTANTLDMAMQRFSRRIGEAANGTGELKDTLKALNISVRDASGSVRPLDAILDDLANAIQNAGSEQEQLGIAFKAFDSEGAAFVNALSNGSAGLKELTDAAREAGAVIDSDAVAAAKRLDDQWTALSETWATRLKSSLIGFARQISGMAGVLENAADQSTARLTDRLIELNGQLRELQKLGPEAANGVAVQLERIAKVQDELDKRRREAQRFAPGPASPQGDFSQNFPQPKAKPNDEKLAAFSLRLAEQREASEKRAADLRARRNLNIDETIKRLEMELQLVGKTNAERQAATTLASLDLEAGDRRAQQITDLISKIDMKQQKIKNLEDANNSAADAAARLRDITNGLFEDISSGAGQSVQDVLRLTQQFVQLAQIASQQDGGGGGVGGFGSLLSAFTGGNPIVR